MCSIHFRKPQEYPTLDMKLKEKEIVAGIPLGLWYSEYICTCSKSLVTCRFYNPLGENLHMQMC